jgi:hypothetical protein
MATFVFFHSFKGYVGDGTIDLDTHAFKMYLSNAAPTAADHDFKADLAAISAAGGYADKTLTCAWTETGAGTGVWRFSIGADQTWTASGAAFDTFRYVIVFDDTVTAPTDDALVGYWDTGGAQNIGDGGSFQANVDADFALFELN